MNIPDYVSPIVAYRVWRWDRSGLASLRDESWPTGHALTARCPGNHINGHQAPQESCTCGIYAARSLDQLREMGYAARGICGEVYLWGVVVEHKLGWRAQFAYPKNLVVPLEMIPDDEKEALSHLEALVAYGVDIFIDDGKKQLPLWKKGSGYEPAGLDYLRNLILSLNTFCPIPTLTTLASQFALFAELTPPEFEHVIGAARKKRFRRRETLFTEGDPVRQVTLVVSGFVKVTQMGLNGNEVILRLSGAGEIVGSYRVSNNLTHCATAQAVQPCVALVWDASTFEKLQARIPVFRRNTVRALEERLLQMEQRLREVSTEKVGSRLSSELVLIARYRELLAEKVVSLQNLSTKTVETHIMRKESVLAGFLEKSQWVNVSSELQPLQLELSVVIVATDNEQRALLQVLVDGTRVARLVHVCANCPVAGDDPVTQSVRAANPDVILVDIPVDKSQFALRGIELLHQELPESAIFAIGSLSQARVIANAMRAGAREFIERPTTTADLLEAFARLTTRTPRPQLLS